MSKSSLEKWYKYFSRKNNHVGIEKWSNPRDWDGASWRLIVGWMWSDFRRFIHRCSQVYSEHRRFGDLLRREHGVSRMRQLTQLCYLAFGLGIPLKHYRAYRLFKPERWKLVDQFLYEHGTLQRKCIANSFPKEEEVFSNKLRFNKYCRAYAVPSPEILHVFKEGKLVYSKENNQQMPKQDLIVKPLTGGQGRGVEKVAYDKEGCWKLEESSYGRKALIEQFAQRSTGNDGLVLQPAIRNHSDWQPFTSGGLSTARVVTARRPDGDIVPIGAALRMPTGDSIKDNFSAGGIASPIEVETGQLGEATTAVPRNGRFELDTHPDTGRPLCGSELPKWDELLKFVLDVHSHFESIFVGWDVSYTTEGLQVIEGNLHWGTRLLEGLSGRPIEYTSYPQLYDAWMRRIVGSSQGTEQGANG